MDTCEAPGCEVTEIYGLGPWCRRHYDQVRNNGKILPDFIECATPTCSATFKRKQRKVLCDACLQVKRNAAARVSQQAARDAVPPRTCPRCGKNELAKNTAYCWECSGTNPQNGAEYRQNWIDQRGPEYRWGVQIKSKYGITKEEYYAILEEQGGGCAVCGATTLRPGSYKKLAVDHCHETDVVRGLLCESHNIRLHQNSDANDLRRMADYLEQPPKHVGKRASRAE